MVKKMDIDERPTGDGLRQYYITKIEEIQLIVNDKTQNLRRLQAQRNELNAKVRMLREELQLLQEQGSYVGEVVKPMDKKKVLVKVHPEGKFVVDIDKNIDINDVTPKLPSRPSQWLVHSSQDFAKQSRPTRLSHDGGESSRLYLWNGRWLGQAN